MSTRVFSSFFQKGQVIETFRGKGVYQPAVDLAVEKLRAGAWVRVTFISLFFSSTRTDLDEPHRNANPLLLYRYTCLERVKFVNPIRTRRIRKLRLRDYSASSGACASAVNLIHNNHLLIHSFLRVCSGRILMETHRLPTIIPMWITGTSKDPIIRALPQHHDSQSTSYPAPRSTGFDKLMPEGRRAPWKFLPRQGARLSVTFGAPLSPAVVHATMASALGVESVPWRDDGEGKELNTGMPVKLDAEAEVKVRIALTELMQQSVEVLGRNVSGDSLTGLPHHHHQDRHHHPRT